VANISRSISTHPRLFYQFLEGRKQFPILLPHEVDKFIDSLTIDFVDSMMHRSFQIGVVPEIIRIIDFVGEIIHWFQIFEIYTEQMNEWKKNTEEHDSHFNTVRKKLMYYALIHAIRTKVSFEDVLVQLIVQMQQMSFS
jgi:hypothetical protein